MTQKYAAKPAAIAAFVYSPDTDASPVLAEAVHRLRERGVQLAGAIQHNEGPCSMMLEILPDGPRMSISQRLGEESRGCRLDSAALAEAASLVRRAIDASPQLVIFNKFGTQEAAGSGMCDEMAAAVLAGVPVLTAVSETLLEDWSAFTGGEHQGLACSADAALAWWDALKASRD